MTCKVNREFGERNKAECKNLNKFFDREKWAEKWAKIARELVYGQPPGRQDRGLNLQLSTVTSQFRTWDLTPVSARSASWSPLNSFKSYKLILTFMIFDSAKRKFIKSMFSGKPNQTERWEVVRSLICFIFSRNTRKYLRECFISMSTYFMKGLKKNINSGWNV